MLRGLTRDPEFLKLWVGETISDFGDQITLLAIPLTAVIVLKASAFQMGLLAAAATAPTALFSLPVGVWVDRLPRRPVLIAADLGRAAALATVPLAFVIGVLGLGQLYVVAFITGTLSVFFIVAYQAYLPGLVGRERLVDANGKLNASGSLAQLTGPGVAGVLVQVFTAPMPVVVDALSFLASVTGLSLIRRAEPALAPRPRNMRAEIREGMAGLLGQPILRTLVACTSVIVLVLSAQTAIFLLYLSRDLGFPPSVIGLLLAFASVGALVGALLASTVAGRIGIGPSFIVGALLAIGTFITRGVAGGSSEGILVALGASQLLGYFGASLFNVNGPSLRQALTPPQLLGRVNASYRFLVWGTGPFGALIGGTLGELLGLRAALLVTGIASLAAIPILFASPLPRTREVPAPQIA
ncbi:MAG TPA: MFS transporter [Candidatus Limnocylindria bacterium]|nr:MFS transporter [Candidatus Limnocylindria bacterium]